MKSWKYGQGRYQELRNGFFRNGTDNLLVEMGKWNLNLQDLLMVLNLFSRVDVTADGAFAFHQGHSKAGDYVELYAPMDTLVILTALQHPLDPNPLYAPKPVQLSWHKVERWHQRTLPHLAPGKRPCLSQHRTPVHLRRWPR